MATHDSIGDFLTIIRNASTAGKEVCVASIKDITSAESLLICLKRIEKNAAKMHEKLTGIIPEKKALAFEMGEALKEII